MNWKIKKRLVFILCCFCLFSFAQNEARKWHFGNNVGLDFSSFPPITFTGSAMSTSAGCTSICNSTGSILFYTDGVTVWNQTHSVMSNGTGLFGSGGAQNSIIVKQPSSSNFYYIFTVASGGSTLGLNYSIVDMNLSAGMGSVTVKNAPLYLGACEEKISAVKHCNQSDIWVMIHQMDTSLFRAYLLTPTGVIPTATVSNCGNDQIGPSTKGGLKFSPNGKKLAQVVTQSNSTGGVTNTSFEVFNFNNSTGSVSNYTFLGGFVCGTGNCWAYGVEFSPDGSKLYSTYHGYIFQYNECEPPVTINGGLGHEENNSINYNRASMQLAPDGKIYIAKAGGTTLDVIHNPNLAGAACGYSVNNLSLGTNTCQFGLPNFVTSYFEKSPSNFTTAPVALPNCLSASFITPTICAFTGYTVSSYQWNFGEPSSGAANSSTLSNPVHTYSTQGTYSVTLILNYVCGRSDTLVKSVSVLNTPLITVSSPSINCGSISSSISISGGTGPYTYTWMPSSQTGSVANNLDPGVYNIIINDNSGGCSGIISTTLSSAVINGTVSANPICAGASSGTAAIFVSGGSGSYTYNWSSTAQTSSLVSGLALGINTVTYTDPANSCILTKTFSIAQFAPISIVLSAISNSACVGNSLTLNSMVTGGSQNFSYTWVTGPSTNSFLVTSNTAGTQVYTLQVTDSFQCSATNTIAVNFINNPVLSVNGNSTCMNSAANMTVTGANTYTWYPTLSYSNILYINNPTITTVYTVSGKVSNCISSATVSLNVFPKPIANLSSNSPLCEGQTLNLSSTAAFSHVWLGPSSYISNIQNPFIANSNLSNAGLYSMTLTSVNSCTNTASINVIINPRPNLSFNFLKAVCPWQTINITASGALSYTWSTGAQFPSVSVNPSVSTVYTVSGTNSFSCTNSSTVYVQVKECTGISEINQDELIQFYPNPSQGTLIIETRQPILILIYDAFGRLVFEYLCLNQLNTLDIGNLSEGIYVIKAEKESKKYFKQLIIRH